jgi:hypothetical protein
MRRETESSGDERKRQEKYRMRSEIMKKLAVIIVISLSCTLPALPSRAQELIVYPAKGQSSATMEKDKAECQAWAKKETGVDPLVLAEQSTTQQAPSGPQGERVKGAAKGALAGAAIGAVAGDAGKGAAIGAATGTVAGGAKQRSKSKAQQQAQQQKQAATKESLEKFKRAYSACLEGKGYTVK